MTVATECPYAVHRVDGEGFSLSDNLIRATVRFELRHQDGGPVAYTTSTWYVHSATPRQISGLRLQASRQLPRFEAYLQRTGKRWEVEQKEKRDAEHAAKKREDRIAYLTKRIPELQAELAALTTTN